MAQISSCAIIVADVARSIANGVQPALCTSWKHPLVAPKCGTKWHVSETFCATSPCSKPAWNDAFSGADAAKIRIAQVPNIQTLVSTTSAFP